MQLKAATALALLLIVTTGCVTPGSRPTPQLSRETNWIFTAAGLENDKSASLTVVVKDAPGDAPMYVEERGAFGKINWLYSILDRLDLHTKMTVDQKEALLRGLLTRIPSVPTADFYRAVSIGGYFTDKPLILYAQAFKPSAKAPAGSALVLQFTGNFIVTTTKATGETKLSPISGMVSPGFNWYTNGIAFADGRLVRGGFLYNKAVVDGNLADSGGDNLLAEANLADIYLKDELPENDAGVEASLISVAANPAASVIVKVTAKLNLGLYYLSADNAAKAEKAFADAKALRPQITEPSLLEVIDVQAPDMLELYRRLTAH